MWGATCGDVDIDAVETYGILQRLQIRNDLSELQTLRHLPSMEWQLARDRSLRGWVWDVIIAELISIRSISTREIHPKMSPLLPVHF